ncbi:hypothetical protein [Levilactobacillus zymae]|uniref:hypothetical protein n=1 Tax=Levilactobacillus zymae TaxID=267363 RepID=UPI0028B6E51C|nr:hypothetical protein [Levilactobacillus zymae]MDT6980924.1 hypothetical protein [Levilactobacillus zymae]
MYETLLVLLLTAGLLGVMSSPRAPAAKLLTEQAFWPAWQRFWTAGCQLASHRRQVLYVAVDTARHQAIIRPVKRHAGPVPATLMTLPLPTSLHVAADFWATAISAHGWAPATTLEWYSRRTGLWWYQTFQLKGALTYVTFSETRRPEKHRTT